MRRIIKTNLTKIKKSLIPKLYNHIYFLRSQDYKYITYEGVNIEEFYDLCKDPYEQCKIWENNNQNYTEMRDFTLNLLKMIKDPKNIQDLLTKKELESVKKGISHIKLAGI